MCLSFAKRESTVMYSKEHLTVKFRLENEIINDPCSAMEFVAGELNLYHVSSSSTEI